MKTIVASSGNELWHGIFSYWDKDINDEETLQLCWRTSKVVGYEICERTKQCKDIHLHSDYDYVRPILLQNEHPNKTGDYYEHYYIQDANGLHPSKNLGDESFKTVEEAKSHVMQLFKDLYRKNYVIWLHELGDPVGPPDFSSEVICTSKDADVWLT